MTLTDCMISGNYSPSGSGGLNNNGTVELTNCTLSGNTSGHSGSGLSTNNGWAELTGCTISNNIATESGGGFASWGGTAPSELSDCTISGNTTSGPGGALDDMAETVYLTNCTLSDNTSQKRGGGVSIEGGATVDLTACTLSSNTSSGLGGGIYNGGTATLTDTIVAGNSSGTGDDIDGDTVTGSHNLVGTDSTGLVNGQNGNIVGVSDPVLSPLGNHGGQTETMAVLLGSPSIGGGTLVSGITSDERGEPLDSPKPDIGAFQSQGFSITLVAGSTPQSTTDEHRISQSPGRQSHGQQLRRSGGRGRCRFRRSERRCLGAALCRGRDRWIRWGRLGHRYGQRDRRLVHSHRLCPRHRRLARL